MNIKRWSQVIRIRMLRVMILIMLVGVAFYYVSEHLTLLHLARAQVSAKPFVLEMQMFDVSSNPSGTLFHTKTVARRSDGTTAEIESIAPTEIGQKVRRVTFMDGVSVTLADLIRAKTTIHGLESKVAQLKQKLINPPPNCIKNPDMKFLGNDTIFGQSVSVLAMPVGNEQQMLIWAAPDLGCENLQYVVSTKQSDGTYKTVTEARPIRLTLADPDSSYFEVNSEYKELRPSEAMKMLLEQMGANPGRDLQEQAKAKKLDEEYLRKK